jgi:hypothetical protein
MKKLVMTLCVAGAATSGCTAPPAAGDTAVAVTERQFFPNCPLAVAQPSVTLVSTAAAWQQMLGAARTSPPPFVASATSFDKHSVLVVASASTPAPRTQLLVQSNAVTLNTAAQGLRVDVQVSLATAQATEMGAAVMGEPCLVMWLARVPPVKTVQAYDATTGALIAQTRLP